MKVINMAIVKNLKCKWYLRLCWSLMAVSTSAIAANDETFIKEPVTANRLAKATAGDKSGAIISKLEFKEAAMIDVIRALSDRSGLNIVASEDAAKKLVTVFL